MGSESSKELPPLSRLSQGLAPNQDVGSKDIPVLNRSRSKRVQFRGLEAGDGLKALTDQVRRRISLWCSGFTWNRDGKPSNFALTSLFTATFPLGERECLNVAAGPPRGRLASGGQPKPIDMTTE